MDEAKTIANQRLTGSSEYFSVAELARMLQLSPAAVRLWIREDRLPTRKEGRRYLLKGDDVAQLLAANPRLGTPHKPRGGAGRGLDTGVDQIPHPQETGPRALATGLLQRGLS